MISYSNLISIMMMCSSLDFKVFVFLLMLNGSFENYLYLSYGLDLVWLVNICSDVVEGMVYFYYYFFVKVVYCDFKFSNIFLDDDMIVFVVDFGIVSLLKGVDENVFVYDLVFFDFIDGLFCGLVGYIVFGSLNYFI